jgi:hypothetical protein
MYRNLTRSNKSARQPLAVSVLQALSGRYYLSMCTDTLLDRAFREYAASYVLRREQLELSHYRHRPPPGSSPRQRPSNCAFGPRTLLKQHPPQQQDLRLHRQILRGCTKHSAPQRRGLNKLCKLAPGPALARLHLRLQSLAPEL